MLSRRELTAFIAGAGIAPGAAWAAVPATDRATALNEVMKLAWSYCHTEGRYLPAWPKIVDLIGSVSGGSDRQWAAMLGDEATALADASQSGLPGDLSTAHVEDALAAIVARSKDRRVVILNEAHVASRHRMFMGRVMRALRREGFTHLACETFSNSGDAAWHGVEALKKGAQVSTAYGYYLADPVFAEAVREALDLGYRLTAYEQTTAQAVRDGPPEQKIIGRETAEAENLAKALAAAPDGRFLVYVGYSHITKTEQPRIGPWMAGRLKASTGIDPLTIQQDGGGSFAPHAPDNAAAQGVMARFSPKDSVAVFDAEGLAWGGKPRGCDLTVFHPPTQDMEGRPGWLAMAQGRRRVAVRLPPGTRDGYVLAQAVRADDPDPAIPADQYLLAKDAREAVFHLRPGRYRVRLETPAGFTPIGETRA